MIVFGMEVLEDSAVPEGDIVIIGPVKDDLSKMVPLAYIHAGVEHLLPGVEKHDGSAEDCPVCNP